jgi:arginine N-succinyltransferase
MNFINLPADEELIRVKIDSSIKSFKNPEKDLSKNYYIFVLENYESGEILGVSMIHAQHGTEDEPHFYLTVGQESKFSQTINTGFVHGTLKLVMDMNGPTEIG